MTDRNPIEDNQAKELQRSAIETHLEKVRAIYKFHFFFTGLVFAVLSFAIQYPVSNAYRWIKVIESMSWVVIGLTGFLALKQIGGFSLDDTMKYHSGLSKKWRKVMWFLFVFGVLLLLIAKISNVFI